MFGLLAQQGRSAAQQLAQDLGSTRVRPGGSESLVTWLDKHGGSVTAASTVALVIITAIYAALTFLAVREQRRQLLAQTMPTLATVISEPEEADRPGEADVRVFYIETRLLSGSPADGVTLRQHSSLSDSRIQVEDLDYTISLGQGERHRWRAEVRDPGDEHWVALVLEYADPAWSILRMDFLAILHRHPDEKPKQASQSWRGNRATVISTATKAGPKATRFLGRIRYRGQNLGEVAQPRDFRTSLDAELTEVFGRMKATLEKFVAE